MPKIFVDANPRATAYYIEDGGSGWQPLPPGYSSMQAEYLAVMYGLNEFFLKWQKEMDARQEDRDPETQKFVSVATPAQKTVRPLPLPILVCSDNEVVVKQLSRQYHIGNDELRKLAQQIWNQCKNLDVKFQWVSRKENPAGNMLP